MTFASTGGLLYRKALMEMPHPSPLCGPCCSLASGTAKPRLDLWCLQPIHTLSAQLLQGSHSVSLFEITQWLQRFQQNTVIAHLCTVCKPCGLLSLCWSPDQSSRWLPLLEELLPLNKSPDRPSASGCASSEGCCPTDIDNSRWNCLQTLDLPMITPFLMQEVDSQAKHSTLQHNPLLQKRHRLAGEVAGF